MPSTNEIVVFAAYGSICAIIIIVALLPCFDEYFSRRICCRRRRRASQSGDIPVVDQAVQRKPSQKQRAEASRPIVVLYRHEQGTKSNCTDCAICLEEFREGDSCRVFPKCKHLYHELCINQWLVKDRHCPLCRDSVHRASVKPLVS